MPLLRLHTAWKPERLRKNSDVFSESWNHDNTVEWQLNKHARIDIEETVIGEWKRPPEYENLVTASNKALDNAKAYILEILDQEQI